MAWRAWTGALCSRPSCCRASGFWRGPSRRSPEWCGRACWRCWRQRRTAWRRRVPYYGRCGGCHYQHAPYEYQLAAKRAILVEALQRLGKMEPPAEIAVVAAEPFGYRNRVQLHVEEKRLGYREARSHKLCAVTECPVGSPKINQAIAALAGMQRDGTVAAIHTVARSVHGRDAGADQRAGDGSSGGAALFRLVRDADSGAGGRRAGLPRASSA